VRPFEYKNAAGRIITTKRGLKMSIQNKKQGWISVHRQITDHWLWKEKPFSRAQAWIDLILMANHTPNKFVLGNELMEVDRGQFITSEKKLMERWGWGKSKLRAYLDILQKDSMIVKKTDRKKTTLTICQYSDWQDLQTTDKPITDRKQTANRPQADTNNNEVIITNKEKNEGESARNLIFCFQKAYKHRFQTEYTITKADKEAAPILAAKLFEVAKVKGDGYPWQWTAKYFWTAMRPEVKNNHTEVSKQVLPDFHFNQLSPAHILKYFDEIHKAVLHKVNPINKPEPGQSIDEILKSGEESKEIKIEFERKSRYQNDQMP
jgi:hypothetical protein